MLASSLSATCGNSSSAMLPRCAFPYLSSQSICALIIITCYVAAAHYLELDCGKRESRQEVTRQNVAVAGLHFLAALFAHAAQMDSHAPADPESLATTEAANTSVTGTSWARLPFGCNALARLCTCVAATNLSKGCLCTCEHIALLLYTFQASAISPLSQMLLWHTLCDVQPT